MIELLFSLGVYAAIGICVTLSLIIVKTREVGLFTWRDIGLLSIGWLPVLAVVLFLLAKDLYKDLRIDETDEEFEARQPDRDEY